MWRTFQVKAEAEADALLFSYQNANNYCMRVKF